MTWEPNEKGTLLIPSGTYHDPDRKHLFIICAANDNRDALFLATLAKWRNSLCDDTCILYAGEHPFIKAKSYIMYRNTRVERTDVIKNGIENGDIIPKDPFESGPFWRICYGVRVSKQTPRKLKNLFGKWRQAN